MLGYRVPVACVAPNVITQGSHGAHFDATMHAFWHAPYRVLCRSMLKVDKLLYLDAVFACQVLPQCFAAGKVHSTLRAGMHLLLRIERQLLDLSEMCCDHRVVVMYYLLPLLSCLGIVPKVEIWAANIFLK